MLNDTTIRAGSVLGALLLAVTTGMARAEVPPVDVWATHDCARVSPVTGKYFIDRPDIHPDYPTGNYGDLNAVWHKRAQRVMLQGARNEFVAFQLIVGAPQGQKGITVTLDKLTGPGGAVIAGKHLALFKAWYVQVKERSSTFDKLGLGLGWYPDPLIPIETGKPAAFDIPESRNKIGPDQRNQTIWVDVYIPKDRTAAPPGTYRGEARVAWPGGKTSVDVKLRVLDVALPDERHMRGDIWNGSLKRMTPEQDLKYYHMFRRHRFLPGVAYYKPKLELDGAKVTIDWTEYDARVGKYIDGSAFTDKRGYWGPGYGVPITHILLPFNCGRAPGQGWPAPLPEGDPTPEYEEAWRETVRQFKAHYDRDPAWRKVGKVVFLGSLDEGYNEKTYRKVEYYSRLIASATGGKPWYLFRVDGGHNFRTMGRLQPFVSLWVMHSFSFNADKMDHYKKLGIEGWFYGDMIYEKMSAASGSNTYIDLDLLTCRGPGWAAWYHKAGFCSWEFDYRPHNAWIDPANFRHKRSGRHQIKGTVFNGSGLLIYRGDFIGSTDPIPSIRFKAHRRGFQDYEYFWLLSQKTGSEAEADRLVKSVIHHPPFGNPSHRKIEIWKNNPEAWDAVRIEIGKRLEKAH